VGWCDSAFSLMVGEAPATQQAEEQIPAQSIPVFMKAN
jgi:hypothetical protein